MKLVRAVAAMSVAVALAFGAAGCAKKEEPAGNAPGAPAKKPLQGVSDAPKAPAK